MKHFISVLAVIGFASGLPSQAQAATCTTVPVGGSCSYTYTPYKLTVDFGGNLSLRPDVFEFPVTQGWPGLADLTGVNVTNLSLTFYQGNIPYMTLYSGTDQHVGFHTGLFVVDGTPSSGGGAAYYYGEFRMSQTPEPSTWATMLLGFGAIGASMRAAKRRKKVAISYA